ncbi:MAG: HD domain-containing protein [Sphingobacteriaceae bacterium]|nr:HD domain-containing protein [Sphingobacteriaceae bacterium]
MATRNKRKIINDPIYGFITLPDDIIYDLINHPYFQRLRNIKQLGLTNLVYPGALHTRFHHAIGAMHLMQEAIHTLKSKEIEITREEEQASLIAILLHDIGHGPFSHALEHSLVREISHEDVSGLIMGHLNKEFKGKLSLAIKIFKNQYKKHFLHQLVSSQLDMDRLDYLKRDSFFTGVSEGVISSDRIIKMLNVAKDQLVVEQKAIYSIEKFLIARRLMYWQVYLHKTVLCAETLLVNILKRAKELSAKGELLFATPVFQLFLKNDFKRSDFEKNKNLLTEFTRLDDSDILASIKVWCYNDDKILSTLCLKLMNRHLNRIELHAEPIPVSLKNKLIEKACKYYNISRKEASYFVAVDSVNNSAYNANSFNINILMSDGKLVDVAQASDQLNLLSLSKTVTKHYVCYPKELE